MNYNIKEEQTDWGKIYYISDNKSFRFSLHYYDDDLSTVYLFSVFVYPEYRRKGIGNIIIKMAEDIAKQMNFKIICLKCKVDSFVHSWYERTGYKDFVTDKEDSSFIWMKKQLMHS